MSVKLNVWHIQEVVDMGEIRYQPVRFTRRNGQPELLDPQPTLEAARKLCGDLTAELL